MLKMEKQQYLTKNQQIVLDLVEKSSEPLKAYSILFNVQKNDKFAVLEAGMDKAGEIDYLTKIIRPDFGIITNISYAHIKNFNSLEGIAKAKSEIINNITEGGKIILNQDDDYFYFIHLAKQLEIPCLSKPLKVIFLSKILQNRNT